MTNGSTDNLADFEAVESLLTVWLKARRDLLVSYTAIAATLERAADADNGALNPALERLCQQLVDYTSAGHFEVFVALQREARGFDDGTDEVGEELIPSIGDTTEVILGFEEKYPGASVQSLDADLSLLGEVLESRFALEDRLIAFLHRIHAVVPLTPPPES
ncbi:MAG: Rsd/AlgQ family anti-sigma factor [Pseudomonadota bacterium]